MSRYVKMIALVGCCGAALLSGGCVVEEILRPVLNTVAPFLL